MSPALTIIIPVHNDADIAGDSVKEFSGESRRWPFTPVRLLLIENGSSDLSAQKVKLLAEQQPPSACEVLAVAGESAGIGYAYHRGIAEALQLGWVGDEDWIMLTASDLPFGFSDVEQFIIASRQNPAGVYIGSKAHPQSKVARGFKRKLAGVCFFLLRRVLLGMKVRDPQGVIFITGKIARKYPPMVSARNFFYTTELLFHIEKSAEKVIELPVVYAGERRPSSVKVLRHGAAVFASLLQLRRNHRRLKC